MELKQEVAFLQHKYELLEQEDELLKANMVREKGIISAEISILKKTRDLWNREQELIANQVTAQRKQGQELLTQTKDVQPDVVVIELFNLGAELIGQKKYAQAIVKLEQALQMYNRSLGENHPTTKSVISWLEHARERATLESHSSKE